MIMYIFYNNRMITEVAAYFMTLSQLDVVKHHILARYVISKLLVDHIGCDCKIF